LAAVPIEATLEVRLNGLVCRLGETNDFVLDGQLVTYNYGLFPDDIVEISYFPEISEE
jgi:hypothetical protein